MLRALCACALLVGATACASIAQTSNVDQSGSYPQAKDRLICRDAVATGSNVPRHACHTLEQWTKMDALG